MKFLFTLVLLSSLLIQSGTRAETNIPVPGFEKRIKLYVDSLRIIDTHEHLFSPEIVCGSYFCDLMLLFQQNGYDDLISDLMPKNYFDSLYNEPLSSVRKWKLIEPFYNNSSNTSCMKILNYGINELYGISDLNENTVTYLAAEIKKTYSTDRFDHILRDSCKIDFVIQDAYDMPGKEYFRYVKRFDNWINIKSHFTIDSLAMNQASAIYTLTDLENSLRHSFEAGIKSGMVAVKVALAYSRTLHFEKVRKEEAEKIFRMLVNGKEDKVIPFLVAKPLQDYMLYRLLELADENGLPVAFHTGMQAGKGNLLSNSDPVHLTNLFQDFPGVKFVLFHGSYPFGGELSTLAKSFGNVYIDMNWTYSISPSYSERYLNEWLEMVPANKIMAFGGDCMAVENVFSELHVARSVIAKVLINKVKEGYFTEGEAKAIARKILHDNAFKFYKL